MQNGFTEVAVGRVAAIVGYVFVHQPPQALDWIKVRAIGRNKMKLDPASRLCQPFLNENGVVVSGIVEKNVNQSF